MGFFDWLLGAADAGQGDQRLAGAIARVIAATDPRLKYLPDVRSRLAPAVSHALAYADRVARILPPSVETTPAAWDASPVLRALFARPADLGDTLGSSDDLHDFLASPAAAGLSHIHCVLAATRQEQSVLGIALEGDILRQDVQQTTISFRDFRLAGFAPEESALRARITDLILEGLALAALRDATLRQKRSDALGFERQLMEHRLHLMTQGRGGLEAMEQNSYRGRDVASLRQQLATNAAELQALKSEGTGLAATLECVIRSLEHAEEVIHVTPLTLYLDAMNVLVDPGPDIAPVHLVEFTATLPERPRRTACLAVIPRDVVAPKRMDLAVGAGLL